MCAHLILNAFFLFDQETSACPKPPENDSCEEAENVASLPAAFSGSLNLAQPYQPGPWRPTYAPTSYFDYYDDYASRPPIPRPDYYDENEWEENYEDHDHDHDHDYPWEERDCYLYGGMQTTWYRLETTEKLCRK